MKTCSKCGDLKSLDEFTVAKKKKGKLYYGYCKSCHSTHTRKLTDDLSDAYITQGLLKSGFLVVTKQMIELKRNLLILKRTIWQNSKM